MTNLIAALVVLSWGVPDTFTDGRPMPPSHIKHYEYYCDGVKLDDTKETKVTVKECSEYQVVTVAIDGVKSAPSKVVFLDNKISGTPSAPTLVCGPVPICPKVVNEVDKVYKVAANGSRTTRPLYELKYTNGQITGLKYNSRGDKIILKDRRVDVGRECQGPNLNDKTKTIYMVVKGINGAAVCR